MLTGLKNRLHDTFSIDAAIEGGFAYKAPPPKLSPKLKKKLLETSMLETPRSSLQAVLHVITPYWTKAKPQERLIGAGLLAASLLMTYYSVGMTVEFGDWMSGLTDTVQSVYQTMMTSRTGLLSEVLNNYPMLQNALASDELSKAALSKYPNVMGILRDPAFAEILKNNAEYKDLLGRNPSLEQVMMGIPSFKEKVAGNPEILTQLTGFKDAMSSKLMSVPDIVKQLNELLILGGKSTLTQWGSTISTTFNSVASAFQGGEILNEAAKVSLKAAWEKKDLPTIALKFTVAAITAYKTGQYASLRWCGWTTGYFSNTFTSPGIAASMRSRFGHIDNPGQRMQEDPKRFTEGVVDVTTGLTRSGITMAAFGGMLWNMGSVLGIPHGMFAISLVYATALTALTFGAGWRLPAIQRNQQRRQADLRIAFDNVYNNGDIIDQNDGGELEQELIKRRLKAAMKNSVQEVSTEVKMIMVDSTAGNLSIPIPWLVGGFAIAAGGASMGTAQTLNYAFGRVTSSLIFIVSRFKTLSYMKATAERMYMNDIGMQTARYLAEEKRQLSLAVQIPEQSPDKPRMQ